MSRILIYVFPGLIDMIVASVMFVCTVRAAEQKLSPSAVANLVTVFSVAYMLACITVGRLVTQRNTAWMLIGACIAIAAVSVGFLAFPQVRAMYPLVFLIALAIGFFFVPFQVFMKDVDQATSRSVAHSTGLYTFSWSTGFALGPFVAAYLWTHLGWEKCHMLNALLAVLAGGGIYLLKHHASAPGAPRAAAEPARNGQASSRYSRMPDLAWMAWVCGGVGALAFALIRGILPSSGVAYELSKPVQGAIFFIYCLAQALVGLALCRSRFWMYRPLPLIAFGLMGIAGLVGLALARTPVAFYAAALTYGIYSGSGFFYMVFHALVHPVKSARYISINEAVVGVTGIAGPFLGGILADHAGLPAPYLATAGLLLGAVAVQWAVHRRHTVLVSSAARRPAENVIA